MEYIIICVCLFCIILNFRNDKAIKLYNIVFIEFGFIILLYFFNIRQLYAVSQKTFFIIFCGIIAYEFGVYLQNKMRSSKNIGKITTSSDDELFISRKLVVILSAFSIMVLSIPALQTIKYLRQGYSLYVLRTDVYGLKTFPEWFDITYIYFILPLSYVLIAYGIIRFFEGIKLEFFFSLVITLMSSFANGGRIILLFFIVQFVFWFFFYKRKREVITQNNNRKKKPNMLFIVLIIVMLFALVVVISRMRGVTKSIVMIINDYFAPSLQYFDVSLKNFDSAGKYCFSFFSFRGYWDPILMVLKSLHIISQRPEIYYTATALNEAADKAIVVGSSGFDMNAFTTMFYAFYVDFDIIGVLVGSVVYGVETARVQYKTYKNQTIYNKLIYALFLNMVVTSFIRFQLVNPAYALSFFWCWVFFGRHKFHLYFGKRRIL